MIPSGYTHFVFADFSGDTGVVKGSTASMVYSWVIVERDQYETVESLIFQAKRLISMKASEEIKYRTVRRHRNRDSILDLLVGAPVRIIIFYVLKSGEERVLPVEVGNAFPIESILKWIETANSHSPTEVQIVIDQTKWQHTDTLIRSILTGDGSVDDKDLVFGQSGSLEILQYADIVAGYFREFLEGLTARGVPPCHLCQIKLTPQYCRLHRKGFSHPGMKRFRQWFQLLRDDVNGSRFIDGYWTIPAERAKDYRFLDCIINRK